MYSNYSSSNKIKIELIDNSKIKKKTETAIKNFFSKFYQCT